MRGFAGAPQAAINALQELLADQEPILGPKHWRPWRTSATGRAQRATRMRQASPTRPC
jgi:hypothetical protein